MASVINAEDLSLNPQEASDISKVVFEKAVTSGDLSKFHAIVTGVQSDTKIPFVGALGLVGEAVEGCDIPSSAEIVMTEKVWTPKNIEFQLSHCSADLSQLLTYAKKKMATYEDQYNYTGSAEETIVLMQAETALAKMLERVLHFGDTSIANVDDGGYLKDGVQVKYFNALNGLWKQIFSSDAEVVTISANAGNSYANQALAADATIGILQSMMVKADSRLKVADGKVILLSRSLADNLMNTAETLSAAMSGDFTKTVAGQVTYGATNQLGVYRGIPVFVVDGWDSTIRAYFDNGTKWDKPHRALFTTIDNIPVGTPSAETLGSLESWYNKDEKKNKVRGGVRVDIKLLQDYMAVAAY